MVKYRPKQSEMQGTNFNDFLHRMNVMDMKNGVPPKVGQTYWVPVKLVFPGD